MGDDPTLYPLKFEPILIEKVWGGSKLTRLFQKKGNDKIGESWELSGVEDNISIVSNGVLQGKTLIDIIEQYQARLVGEGVFKRFGSKFPLLFKFIDARENLSVQLHPNDSLAKERHGSFGKTEMWYIMQAEKEASIILGFNTPMDEATYLKNISENKITEILYAEPVKEEDAFFISPGTVHAIGAGVVLAEIQQTSDITYRIYDWDRLDNGKFRELHTDLAIAAIDYQQIEAKINYSKNENTSVQLKSCPFFETNRLKLTKNMKRDLSIIDSFVVYMCVAGEAIIETSEAFEILKKGETLLIPAFITNLLIRTSSATILEVYVP
jgi:mannose-6-phosphate isomerase